MKWYEVDNKKKPSISSIAGEIEPFNNEQYIVNSVLDTTYNVISQIKGVASPDAVIELIVKEFSTNRGSALEIGTATHSLIEKALQTPSNKINTDGLSGELFNTARAWNSFMRVRNIKFPFSEMPVYCDKFAGRLDLIAVEHKSVVLLDIKTTNIKDDKVFLSRSHLLQLTMYFMCIKYMVKNKIYKYKVKDLKYDTEYEVSLPQEKIDMLEQLVKRPTIALLYLDKSNGKHAYFKFGRREIFACKTHINAYLKYSAVSKRTSDITKRSRYVSLYKIPITKIKGENHIKASLLKDYLRRQNLFLWNNNNSYFVFVGRHIKSYVYEGVKYFREEDFWYIVDLLQNKKFNKENK